MQQHLFVPEGRCPETRPITNAFRTAVSTASNAVHFITVGRKPDRTDFAKPERHHPNKVIAVEGGPSQFPNK